jgi:hypothetical protein
VLFEAQFAIKIEAQVPPIGLRFQWVALSIRLIAEVKWQVIISGFPGEVK